MQVDLTPPAPSQSDDTVRNDIEDLEKRVSALERRMGMTSPQDEQDPLKQAIAGTKGAFGS